MFRLREKLQVHESRRQEQSPCLANDGYRGGPEGHETGDTILFSLWMVRVKIDVNTRMFWLFELSMFNVAWKTFE